MQEMHERKIFDRFAIWNVINSWSDHKKEFDDDELTFGVQRNSP